MSTAVAPAKSADKLSVWIKNEEVRDRFSAMLTEVMPVDLFISHMMVAFQDPKVAKCSDRSKYEAMHNCAALGLLPTLGQVVLIPYKDTLKAMPQWQGYKAIMERIPDVLEVTGVLVHKKDEFAYVNGMLHHEYDPLDDAREFKDIRDIRGGYCVILFTNGRPPKHHFTTAKHIEKARGCVQTQDVWNKWFYQMALKTLYRDCYARRAVPIDPVVGARVEKIINADDDALGNTAMGSHGGKAITATAVTSRVLGQPQPQESEPEIEDGEIIDIEMTDEEPIIESFDPKQRPQPSREVLEWIEGLEVMDLKMLKKEPPKPPAKWSAEDKRLAQEAIDRMIGGSGGGGGTLFDNQVSATEGGM